MIDATTLIDALPLRERPSQARAHRTLLGILTASWKLVADGGVHALSTAAVAQAADVPIGTVYRYFADRNALIEAMVAQARFEMDMLALQDMVNMDLLNWREGLRSFLGLSAQYARSRPGYVELVALTQAGAGRIADASWERWTRALLASPAVVKAGVPEEVGRLHASIVVGAAQGVMPRIYRATDDEVETLLDELCRMLVSYIEDAGGRHGVRIQGPPSGS